MTTEIQFYHLLTTPLHLALPKLMEKALQADLRVVIHCADSTQQSLIDDALWAADPGSFIPHGLANDAADQLPIALTLDAINPNQATVIVATHGQLVEPLSGFIKLLDVFDGHDDEAVSAARTRWKHYQQLGHSMRYIQQQKGGGWKQMHEVNAPSALLSA